MTVLISHGKSVKQSILKSNQLPIAAINNFWTNMLSCVSLQQSITNPWLLNIKSRVWRYGNCCSRRGPRFNSSPYTVFLITTCNSSSRRSNHLFWLPWVLQACAVHTDEQAHTIHMLFFKKLKLKTLSKSASQYCRIFISNESSSLSVAKIIVAHPEGSSSLAVGKTHKMLIPMKHHYYQPSES